MPRGIRLAFVALGGLLIFARPSLAPEGSEAYAGFERTPPRLSLAEGEVSFWRPGAEGWAPARVNTPLAAGDELYTGSDAHLELQIGDESFSRAAANTQLGLSDLEPDYLQLQVRGGRISLDLRSVQAGETIEIDTPNAAFRVERSGYYGVEVRDDATAFTTRRGGHATLNPVAGQPVAIAASEQVVVTGTDQPRIESYAAPELDAWDRWNYARTDELLDAVSARYVSAGIYGAADLDHYGDWRIVPIYGPVWVPRDVAVGWVPYGAGRWIFDPYYDWTWVDAAPWGWAPFHYGRWVFVSGYWAWCPGPIVVRPYYAPALVSFFGGGGLSVGVTIGVPFVSWVALGWGEPIVPWWGPPSFREHCHWAGWGGPHFVNKVEVPRQRVFAAKDIDVYQNAGLRDAVVGLDRSRFGRYSGKSVRYERVEGGKLTPLHGDIDIRPDRSSLVAGSRFAPAPPARVRERAVVAFQEPHPEAPAVGAARPQHGAKGPGPPVYRGGPPARVVPTPAAGAGRETSRRAPFGRESDVERSIPAPAPHFERSELERTAPPARPPSLEAPAHPVRPPQEAAPPATRGEKATAAPGLPGEPANRVYRGWSRPLPERGEAAPHPPRNAPGAASEHGGPHRP